MTSGSSSSSSSGEDERGRFLVGLRPGLPLGFGVVVDAVEGVGVGSLRPGTRVDGDEFTVETGDAEDDSVLVAPVHDGVGKFDAGGGNGESEASWRSGNERGI